MLIVLFSMMAGGMAAAWLAWSVSLHGWPAYQKAPAWLRWGAVVLGALLFGAQAPAYDRLGLHPALQALLSLVITFFFAAAGNLAWLTSETGRKYLPQLPDQPEEKRLPRPKSELSVEQQRAALVETIRHGLSLSPEEAKSFTLAASLADYDPALRDPRAFSTRSLVRLRLMADDYFQHYAANFPNLNGRPWPEARKRLERWLD